MVIRSTEGANLTNPLANLSDSERTAVNRMIDQSVDRGVQDFQSLQRLFVDMPQHLVRIVAKLLFDSEWTVASNQDFSETDSSHSSAGSKRSFTKKAGVKPAPLAVGDVLGDYRILRELGEGSYARVYLANQISLGRMVALKVSVYHGQEAKNLARLEHYGIVQVYSEHVDEELGINLICMQYVPGMNLQQLLKKLMVYEEDELSGEAILAILQDSAQRQGSSQNSCGLKQRSYLEAVLTLVRELATALHYAHEMGVLHLDIKPGNVLMNPQGQARIVDFNISLSAGADLQDESVFLGGTLRYTSPEQKLAIRDSSGQKFADIDRRSDIFSLGYLLCELAELVEDQPLQLKACIERAIAPERSERFQTMAEFAAALDSVAIVLKAQNEAQRDSSWRQKIQASPVLYLGLGCLVPQIIGSAFNISYNLIAIISQLSGKQIAVFNQTVVVYNIVLYPLALLIFVSSLRFFAKRFKDRAFVKDASAARALRETALRIPGSLALASSVGWLPGAIVFAATIDLIVGDVSSAVYYHFAVSCLISWLLALAYSFLYLDFILVKFFIPQIWSFESDFKAELQPLKARVAAHMRFCFVLASIIPLTGAVVAILSFGKVEMQNTENFQILTSVLIAIGGVGMYLASRVARYLKTTMRRFES